MIDEIRVDASTVIDVKDEKLFIPNSIPQGWSGGIKFSAVKKGAPGAIDPSSVVVKYEGKTLQEGKDYIIEKEWGSIGLPEGSVVSSQDQISVDYSYSLLRIDSIVMHDGQTIIVKGEEKLTTPRPPRITDNSRRLANVFVDYHSDGLNCSIYPVKEFDVSASTCTTSSLIPRITKKLKLGEKVQIVCWGDSVTYGSDLRDIGKNYPCVLEKQLKKKFQNDQVFVETVAVGGTNSRQWIFPEDSNEFNPECRWGKVASLAPDLIIVEFLNDCDHVARSEVFQQVYTDIIKRAKDLGSELVFILPNFTRGMDMNTDDREYVLLLKEFAKENGIAIADTSSRWANLWKEGLPYVILLENGFNHPDWYGHQLFVEELLKCFEL